MLSYTTPQSIKAANKAAEKITGEPMVGSDTPARDLRKGASNETPEQVRARCGDKVAR